VEVEVSIGYQMIEDEAGRVIGQLRIPHATFPIRQCVLAMRPWVLNFEGTNAGVKTALLV
jgi:hypothetical protein